MSTPAYEDSLLSGSAEKAMATLLGVMIGLKEVYTKEIKYIKARETEKFLNLQPTKEAYTRDYQMLVKEIQARSISIKKMDNPLRERLITEQKELEVLAEQSMSHSLRMAQSLQRVQERLINAAREAIQSENVNYGQSGGMEAVGRPIATAYNQAV